MKYQFPGNHYGSKTMKLFLKFFFYGICISGILLFLTYLFRFAPLDPQNENILSNGLITGIILLSWGVSKIRSNENDQATSTDLLYGVKRDGNNPEIRDHERMTDSNIPSALGLFLAGCINILISFYL